VGAGDEELGEIGFRVHDANGQAAADGFAEGHDVREDHAAIGASEMLVGEPPAGSAAAGPDFVEDEREIISIAQLADFLDEVVGKEIDAALALHRFEHDGGGFGVDGFFEQANVVGLDVDEAGDHRIETGFDFGIAGGADHGERSAVKTFDEGDDLPSIGRARSSPQAGEFAGGFVGFQAAVAEEGLAGEGGFVEALGDFDLRLGVKSVADMPEFFGLLHDGFGQSGMTVAEDGAAESSEEIDVALAGGIPEEGALAARHDDGEAGVISNQNIFSALDQS
jgi:hypothetical protein